MLRKNFTLKFSVRLNRMLDVSNMTHKKLASKTGISVSTIDGYCVGKSAPSLYHACKIAKALDITLDALVGGFD